MVRCDSTFSFCVIGLEGKTEPVGSVPSLAMSCCFCAGSFEIDIVITSAFDGCIEVVW